MGPRIRKSLVPITLFLFFIGTVKSESTFVQSPKPVINWKGKRYKVINSYLRLHRTFSKKVCTPGTEESYWRLKKANGEIGQYVPTLKGNSLDRNAISKNLHFLKKKDQWIEKIIDQLEQKNILEEAYTFVEDLDVELSAYQFYKYKVEVEKDKKSEAELFQSFVEIKNIFFKALKKIPYLRSFQHPVDFFKLRKNFDQVKFNSSKEQQKNSIFFYRKLVEDGTTDQRGRRNDKMLRALIDSLYFRFQSAQGLDENMRYDLNEFVKSAKKFLLLGKEQLRERLARWKIRNLKALDFYQGLLKMENAALKSRILNKLSKARFELTDFVYNKQAETYLFWIKQRPIFRALYVLETILFNEVSDLDGRDGLDRQDVIQVVFNRLKIPKYRILKNHQKLAQILKTKKIDFKKYFWENILFSEGEFSFTYYFISSVIRIFCPSMTRRARFIRKENLKFSLKLLKSPNWNFPATRYFSRGSMLGRVDMSKLWHNHLPIPLRPGLVSIKRRILSRRLKKGNFEYLFQFKFKDRVLEVYQFDEEIFSFDRINQKFYKYRNPHYFQYFSPS